MRERRRKMVVQKTKQTKADVVKENQEVEAKKIDATNALLSTLDLPVQDPNQAAVQPEVKEEKKPEAKKEEQLEPEKVEPKEESEVEEFQSEKSDEEILDAKDTDLNEQELRYKKQLVEEQGEEELIPKSKVDKMLKRMEKRIESLVAEKHKEEPQASDPDKARLEKYSLDKLVETKESLEEQIDEEVLKVAKGEVEDLKQVKKWRSLGRKIDDAIRTYDQRFQQKQIAHLQRAASEFEDDPDIATGSEEDTAKNHQEIRKLAEEIYVQYPRLAESEDGQAMALRQAVDKWKMKKEFSIKASGVDRLKKTNKRLLRRTSLDSNMKKSDGKRKHFDSLKQKAGRGGTDEDRKTFVEEHPMFNVDSLIPDEFKERK